MGLFDEIFDFFFGWLIPEPEEAGTEYTRQKPAKANYMYGRQKGAHGVIVRSFTDNLHSGGTPNESLYVQVIWSAGQIDSVDEIYLDDKPISESGKYAAAYHSLDGSDLTIQGEQNYTFEGRGCAFSVLYFRWNSEKMNHFPNITMDGRGRKVKNLTNDQFEYSNDPMDCLYDYITDVASGQFPEGRLNKASFLAERAFTSTMNSFTPVVNGYTSNRPLMTMNILLDGESEVFENINLMRQSCRAYLPYNAATGQYHVAIERDKPNVDPSTFEITDDNIMSDFVVEDEDIEERYNSVTVKYFSEANRGKETSVTYPIDNSAYLSQDNGISLTKTVTLNGINNPYEAVHSAHIIFHRSRDSLKVKVSTKFDDNAVLVGDVIYVSNAAYGMVQKPFIVLVRTVTSKKIVKFELLEYQESIYPWVENPIASIPDSIVPDYETVNKVTNLVYTELNDGTGQGVISWDSDVNNFNVELAGEIIASNITTKQFIVSNKAIGNYAYGIIAINGLGYTSAPETITANVTKTMEEVVQEQMSWTISPENGATDGAVIGDGTSRGSLEGQFDDQTKMDTYFSDDVIKARVIDVDDFYAQTATVTGTLTVTGAQTITTIDGAGNTPFSIRYATGGALLDIEDVDGVANLNFNGSLGVGTISSIDAFTPEILALLQPSISGSTGGTATFAGLPAPISADLQTGNVTLTNTNAQDTTITVGIVDVGYYHGVTPPTFSDPSYRIELYYGAGATPIQTKTVQGTTSSSYDGELGYWDADFSINSSVTFNHAHGVSDGSDLSYSVKVVRLGGSYNNLKLSAFSVSQPTSGGALSGSVAWSAITDKPLSFPPSSHSHGDDYLGANAKAVDSDKLDGLDSTSFARYEAVPTGGNRLAADSWIATYGTTTNIDHVWYDDSQLFGANGVYTFVADGSFKSGTSNAAIKVKSLVVQSGGGVYSDYNDAEILKDHANGHVTVSAAGGNLYLGYQNTNLIRVHADLKDINGNSILDTSTGLLYEAGTALSSKYMSIYSSEFKIRDARNDGDITPASFENSAMSLTFSDDIVGTNRAWDSVITVKGWNDDYEAWQIIGNSTNSSSDGKLYYRHGDNATWNPIQTFAFLEVDNVWKGLQRFDGGVVIDTAGGTDNALKVSRTGSQDTEVLRMYVNDRTAVFNYVEDTSSEGTGNFGSIAFQLAGNSSESIITPLHLGQSSVTVNVNLDVVGEINLTNAGNSFIDNQNGGYLAIRNQVNAESVYVQAKTGGGTTYTGLKVTGTTTEVYGGLYHNDNRQLYAVSDGVKLDDNKVLRIGSSSDLTAYHNGTNSFIDNNTGHLYIRNLKAERNTILQAKAADNNVYTGVEIAVSGNDVYGELKQNGISRIAAASYGAYVNGELRASDVTATGNVSATGIYGTTEVEGLNLGVTNSSPTSGRGLSLYGGANSGLPTYGVTFAGTATYGTHGDISASDWATYFTMNSGGSSRGWIFGRSNGTGNPMTNVASIDGVGNAKFDGVVTAELAVRSSRWVGVKDVGGDDCYAYWDDSNPTYDGVGYGGQLHFVADKGDMAVLRTKGFKASGAVHSPKYYEAGLPIDQIYLRLADLSYDTSTSYAVADAVYEQFKLDQEAGKFDDYDGSYASLATGFVDAIFGHMNLLAANKANINSLSARTIEVSGRRNLINNWSATGNTDGIEGGFKDIDTDFETLGHNLAYEWQGEDTVPQNATLATGDKHTFSIDRGGKGHIYLEINDAESGINVGLNGVEVANSLNRPDNETCGFTIPCTFQAGSNEISIWSDTGDGATVFRVRAFDGEILAQKVSTTGNTYGGYSNYVEEVNHDAIYELTFWIYGDHADNRGTRYWGISAYDANGGVGVESINSTDRSVWNSYQDNHYFWNGDVFQGNWRKMRTYVLGANVDLNAFPETLNISTSGVCRLNPNTKRFRTRWLNYYNSDAENTDSTSKTEVTNWFANPSCREIGSGLIVADNIKVTDLEAIGATIAGWSLTDEEIRAGSGSTFVGINSGSSAYAFWAGNSSGASAPFSVSKQGALKATNADISGKITATSGSIGGWSMDTNRLVSGSGSSTVTISGNTAYSSWVMWAGNSSAGSSPFRLSRAGALYATNATIEGTVTATSGSIGSWTILAATMYTGTYQGANDYTTSGITLYGGSAGAFRAKEFRIDTDGTAHFKGALEAPSGTIGGWSIDAGYLWTGTKKTSDGFTTGGTTFNSNGAIRSVNFRIDNDGSAFFKGDFSGGSGEFTNNGHVLSLNKESDFPIWYGPDNVTKNKDNATWFVDKNGQHKRDVSGSMWRSTLATGFTTVTLQPNKSHLYLGGVVEMEFELEIDGMASTSTSQSDGVFSVVVEFKRQLSGQSATTIATKTYKIPYQWDHDTEFNIYSTDVEEVAVVRFDYEDSLASYSEVSYFATVSYSDTGNFKNLASGNPVKYRRFKSFEIVI